MGKSQSQYAARQGYCGGPGQGVKSGRFAGKDQIGAGQHHETYGENQ